MIDVNERQLNLKQVLVTRFELIFEMRSTLT